MTLVERTLPLGKAAWHRRRPRAEIGRSLILSGAILLSLVALGAVLAPLLSGWGPEEIDTYVDISDSMDIKVDALRCHRSQIGGLSEDESIGWLRQWSAEMGKKAGFEYAEGYRVVRFRT